MPLPSSRTASLDPIRRAGQAAVGRDGQSDGRAGRGQGVPGRDLRHRATSCIARETGRPHRTASRPECCELNSDSECRMQNRVGFCVLHSTARPPLAQSRRVGKRLAVCICARQRDQFHRAPGYDGRIRLGFCRWRSARSQNLARKSAPGPPRDCVATARLGWRWNSTERGPGAVVVVPRWLPSPLGRHSAVLLPQSHTNPSSAPSADAGAVAG